MKSGSDITHQDQGMSDPKAGSLRLRSRTKEIRGISLKCLKILRNSVIARAKRGRVVENEYEKANRRPDPADTASQKARAQLDAKMPKGCFQNRSSPFFRGSGLRFRSAIFVAKMQFHEIEGLRT